MPEPVDGSLFMDQGRNFLKAHVARGAALMSEGSGVALLMTRKIHRYVSVGHVSGSIACEEMSTALLGRQFRAICSPYKSYRRHVKRFLFMYDFLPLCKCTDQFSGPQLCDAQMQRKSGCLVHRH